MPTLQPLYVPLNRVLSTGIGIRCGIVFNQLTYFEDRYHTPLRYQRSVILVKSLKECVLKVVDPSEDTEHHYLRVLQHMSYRILSDCEPRCLVFVRVSRKQMKS